MKSDAQQGTGGGGYHQPLGGSDLQPVSWTDETPPLNKVTVYVPVEGEPSADQSVFAQTMDDVQVEVVDAYSAVGGTKVVRQAQSYGYGDVMSSVQSVTAASTGSFDLVLGGPGLPEITLRADNQAARQLQPGSLVFGSKQSLAKARRLQLRPVEVEFANDPLQSEWSALVWLPITRIHRPRRKGCFSVYETIQSEATEHSVDVNVASLSLEGRCSFTVERVKTLRAEATCKQVSVPAHAEVSFGWTLVGGTPVAYGARVVLRSANEINEWSYEDIPANADQCNWPEANIPVERRAIARLRNASGTSSDAASDELKFTRTATGRLSVGVQFGNAPVALSLAYTRTSSEATHILTSFVPGADYIGYSPPGASEVERCWSVSRTRRQ